MKEDLKNALIAVSNGQIEKLTEFRKIEKFSYFALLLSSKLTEEQKKNIVF